MRARGAGRIVNFTGIEELEVDGAGGPDQIYILSTNPELTTTIVGGSGDDTIHMGGTPPPLVETLQGIGYESHLFDLEASGKDEGLAELDGQHFDYVVIDVGRTINAVTLRSLDSWSATLAEARADMRLWEQARRDPRLMNELMQARMRDTDDGDFETALAPMGLEPGVVQKPVSGWGRFPERLAESRARNIHLYYI